MDRDQAPTADQNICGTTAPEIFSTWATGHRSARPERWRGRRAGPWDGDTDFPDLPLADVPAFSGGAFGDAMPPKTS